MKNYVRKCYFPFVNDHLAKDKKMYNSQLDNEPANYYLQPNESMYTCR